MQIVYVDSEGNTVHEGDSEWEEYSEDVPDDTPPAGAVQLTGASAMMSELAARMAAMRQGGEFDEEEEPSDILSDYDDDNNIAENEEYQDSENVTDEQIIAEIKNMSRVESDLDLDALDSSVDSDSGGNATDSDSGFSTSGLSTARTI